ncbi:MAG: GDSL family lipase [Firmicutes bacterium HGW-Firmicutes-12]|jgi:lysophospholipase L1-like esterase|nr:MAG: GDSL family lipase [Firmicutes bacterium HGW-Firmicutes-12]
MSEVTFVALGASITYGYPYKQKDSWVEHIREKTDWQVINSGIPGNTFEDMYNRLKLDVLDHNPDIVCVMAGTNDVNQCMSQPQIQQSFLKLLTELLKRNIQVLVGLPLPVDTPNEGALRLLRAWLIECCEEKDLVLINFYQDFIDAQGEIREDLLLDGCHPRKKGYAIMGERAVKTLQENDIID